MFDVKIDSELPKAIEKLKTVAPEKWAQILRYAQNETGFYVLNKYKKEIPKFIDRPTNFTINSMFLDRATKEKPDATVRWKDARNGGNTAGQYLRPEVEGGKRAPKKFEKALQAAGLMPQGMIAVPSDDAPRDAFGNVPASLQAKILEVLKANTGTVNRIKTEKLKRGGFVKLARGVLKTAGNYDKTQKREDRARSKAAKYFTAVPGQSRLAPGIYERLGAGAGQSALPTGASIVGNGARQLFFFTNPGSYRKSFPFEQIGKDAALAKFGEKLDEAILKFTSAD